VAGTFKIIDMNLLTSDGKVYDIRTKFKDLQIFEDIFSPFITGHMTLVDTSDVIDLFSTNSTDLLQLNIISLGLDESKDQNKINTTFWIYKRGDRILSAERTVEIKLYFGSLEMMLDTHTSVKHPYINKPADKVISDIITKYYYTDKSNIDKKLQKKLITNTNKNKNSRNVTFVSNLWKASKCFTYCQNHSIDDSGDATYFFFENKGGFNFLNFTDMVQLSTIQGKIVPSFILIDSNFTADSAPSAGGGVKVDFNPEMDSKIITGSRRVGQLDALKMFDEGGLKMGLHSFDLLKRNYSYTESTPIDVLPKNPLLNDIYPFDPVFISNIDSVHTCVASEFDLLDNTTDSSSNVTIIAPRNISIANFMNNSLELDLMGRTDYTVGQIIQVELTRKITINKGDPESKYKDFKYSGMYICSAIAHKFDLSNKHTVTLELCRDGILSKPGT